MNCTNILRVPFRALCVQPRYFLFLLLLRQRLVLQELPLIIANVDSAVPLPFQVILLVLHTLLISLLLSDHSLLFDFLLRINNKQTISFVSYTKIALTGQVTSFMVWMFWSLRRFFSRATPRIAAFTIRFWSSSICLYSLILSFSSIWR